MTADTKAARRILTREQRHLDWIPLGFPEDLKFSDWTLYMQPGLKGGLSLGDATWKQTVIGDLVFYVRSKLVPKTWGLYEFAVSSASDSKDLVAVYAGKAGGWKVGGQPNKSDLFKRHTGYRRFTSSISYLIRQHLQAGHSIWLRVATMSKQSDAFQKGMERLDPAHWEKHLLALADYAWNGKQKRTISFQDKNNNRDAAAAAADNKEGEPKTEEPGSTVHAIAGSREKIAALEAELTQISEERMAQLAEEHLERLSEELASLKISRKQ